MVVLFAFMKSHSANRPFLVRLRTVIIEGFEWSVGQIHVVPTHFAVHPAHDQVESTSMEINAGNPVRFNRVLLLQPAFLKMETTNRLSARHVNEWSTRMPHHVLN